MPGFDDSAGLIWAELMAVGKAAGRPRSALDMIIAAVARANECQFAVLDFEIAMYGGVIELIGIANPHHQAGAVRTGSARRSTGPNDCPICARRFVTANSR